MNLLLFFIYLHILVFILQNIDGNMVIICKYIGVKKTAKNICQEADQRYCRS